jgi:5-methylcytosine-specific restriction endonuclease McrA
MGAVSAAAKEKQCLYRLQWARENREKRRESERRYALTHPEKMREKVVRHGAYVRAWQKAKRERCPEEMREKYRRWYYANTALSRELKLDWVKRNRPAVVAQIERRRALKNAAPGAGVSREEWQAILDYHGHRCIYCASTEAVQMDHIDPLSKGGAHDPENVVPACRRCNSSKQNKTLLVWLVGRAA